MSENRDLRKFNDRCVKLRPDMLNMEELLTETWTEGRGQKRTVVVVRNRPRVRKWLNDSSKEKNMCQFPITGRHVISCCKFKRGLCGLFDIEATFQEKIDRTLVCQSIVWLEDMEGSMEEARKRLFELLEAWKKLDTKQAKENPDFSQKNTWVRQ